MRDSRAFPDFPPYWSLWICGKCQHVFMAATMKRAKEMYDAHRAPHVSLGPAFTVCRHYRSENRRRREIELARHLLTPQAMIECNRVYPVNDPIVFDPAILDSSDRG